MSTNIAYTAYLETIFRILVFSEIPELGAYDNMLFDVRYKICKKILTNTTQS